MPRFGYVLYTLACSLGLAACGVGAPTCDSTETKNLVISIVKSQMSQRLLNVASWEARSRVDQESWEASKIKDTVKMEQETTCKISAGEHFKKLFVESFGVSLEEINNGRFVKSGTLLDLSNACLFPANFAMKLTYAEAQNRCDDIYSEITREVSNCWKEANELAERAISTAHSLRGSRLKEIEDISNRSATYVVDTIRVTAKNDDTGANTCAARLQVDIPNIGGAEQQIAYQVERTTDGKLYVAVLGVGLKE